MRKRVSVMATISVLIVLVVATVAARAEVQKPLSQSPTVLDASSYPSGTTWTSPFVIQNIGSLDATISVEFREVGKASSDPDYVLSTSTPIKPGAVFTVRPQNESALAGNKKYSVVVSSDQPIAAIVNEQGAPSGQAMGYAGAKAGAAKLYFPNFNKNYSGENFNTPFYVQNASSTSGSITVHFYDANTGAEVTAAQKNATLAAGVSYEVDPVNVSELANGRYAVMVESTGISIVGALNQVSNIPGQEMGVNGVTGGARTVFLPNINKNYGAEIWVTPVLVQNVGTANTAVYMDYFAVNVPNVAVGTLVKTYTLADALAPGKAVTERPHNRPDSEIPAGSYSAKVRADSSEVAAAVNQQSRNQTGGAMGYIGFTGGASKVYIPNINKRYGAEKWTTNVVVQNMGTADAIVNYHYVFADNTTLDVTNQTIGPGRSMPIRPNNVASIPDSTKASMWIESTNGQPLQAIVNQQSFAGDPGRYPGAISVEGLVP